MPRNSPLQPVASPTMRMFWSSDDLLGEIQGTLAALADLECRHQIEQEPLKQGSEPVSEGERFCAERESRHQEGREPYLHRLNELERRMQALTGCR
jgi:hypothetical protein